MGVRLTGVSTPFFGANWEYKDNCQGKEGNASLPVVKPHSKLKVFISSACGIPKYDKVRKKLKEIIEQTGLADVYAFECAEGSTLTAEAHYTFFLRDCDVCIFLIDNKDGVNSGVQKEIDIARKDKIKSIFYFCEENSKEMTAVEQSIRGAQYAKSQRISRFSDLAEHGAQALIDDIVTIYHNYCKGRIVQCIEEPEPAQQTTIAGIESLTIPLIQRTVLKNTDKCKAYFISWVLHSPYNEAEDNTNKIDEWGRQFLPILFEGKTIKEFNVSMFLKELQKHQQEDYHQVVRARWDAIQSYYEGDIDACVEKLQEVLKIAKTSGQPEWVVKDILIDLRNQELQQMHTQNIRRESDAQKELSKSDEEVYYPVLDRINESLQGKYVSDLLKERIKSPFTFSFGNTLNPYGEMLASSYIVALYNGSLTHIRQLYDRMKLFSFYLCTKFDDWVFKLNLLIMEIFNGEEKDVTNTLIAYPELLNQMSSEDALLLMRFCDNHPLEYRRIISQLIAFGVSGYYLDDTNFRKYSESTLKVIRKWLNTDQPILIIGDYIFPCLEKVSYRLLQDDLAEICCLFMEKQYTRWYGKMFHFIATSIRLDQMNDSVKQMLIDHLVLLFDSEKERELIKAAPGFLIAMRNQDRNTTDELERKVQEYLPDYYEYFYKVETTHDFENEMPGFIRKCVRNIEKANEEQGRNGVYFEHGIRNIARLRSTLMNYKGNYDPELMTSVIMVAAETLLHSKEGAREKLDAVSLLICIVLNYPEDYKQNIHVFTELYENRDQIKLGDEFFLTSNIDELPLKIVLCLLFSLMNEDVSFDLLECLSYIQENLSTTISVTDAIAEYLETSETATFSPEVHQIILQNVLMWAHSKNVNIRYNSARILLGMLRTAENINIKNHQLIHLIDTESLYVKNLILRNINRCEHIDHTTREYVFSKCAADPCFVVRMVCGEEKEKMEKI